MEHVDDKVRIGILSPAAPDRPHFKSLDAILPPGVAIVHEGLGLLGESYRDLIGKTDQIVARAMSFIHRHEVRGLMVTGGFVTLFNPELEQRVADAVRLPVVGAVRSAVAALRAFGAKSVLLMTPFDAASDEIIKNHLHGLGFAVHLGPAFENRQAGAPVELSRDELFDLVRDTMARYPGVEAIYFQGATMDPLPILQRLEDALGVPVVTSNSAMIWQLLSRLQLCYSMAGHGRLLKEWPAIG